MDLPFRKLKAILREPYLLLLSTTVIGLFGISIADHTSAQNWVFTIIVLVILLAALYSLDSDHPKNRPWMILGVAAAASQVSMFFDTQGHIRVVWP